MFQTTAKTNFSTGPTINERNLITITYHYYLDIDCLFTITVTSTSIIYYFYYYPMSGYDFVIPQD